MVLFWEYTLRCGTWLPYVSLVSVVDLALKPRKHGFRARSTTCLWCEASQTNGCCHYAYFHLLYTAHDQQLLLSSSFLHKSEVRKRTLTEETTGGVNKSTKTRQCPSFSSLTERAKLLWEIGLYFHSPLLFCFAIVLINPIFSYFLPPLISLEQQESR